MSELIERAKASEEIAITRRGKSVAQLTTISQSRKRIDVHALRRLTATLPVSSETADDLVRSMRDSDRY